MGIHGSEKRASGKTTAQEIAGYGTEEPLPMEYAGRKIPLPKERKQGEPFPVRRHQIDTNHHVNNSQYVQMALDVWEEMGTPSKIRELRLSTKNQQCTEI